MRHRWVLMKSGDKHAPVKLSDHLTDKSYTLPGHEDIVYEWKKVEHSDATIDYVCFHRGQRVGIIPIDWADDDKERESFWSERKGQKLSDIQIAIMERHYLRVRHE